MFTLFNLLPHDHTFVVEHACKSTSKDQRAAPRKSLKVFLLDGLLSRFQPHRSSLLALLTELIWRSLGWLSIDLQPLLV